MKTEDIIKELELNYGYTFANEGTDNKWQFEWICEMINDVQNVVTKNCNLHVVSQQRELLLAFHKSLQIYTTELNDGLAELDVDNFLANNCG